MHDDGPSPSGTEVVVTPNEIVDLLTQKLGNAVTEAMPDDKHPRVHTTDEYWRAMAELMYGDGNLAFNWLACITSVDYVATNQLAAIYDLYSTSHKHWFAVKVTIDRDDPHIPSVMDLWPAADWHEREAFDLMGIVFDGHTDLRRILLPEDWEGHPLRKDYQYPRQYHGIPGTYELDWQQKTNYPG